jgi:hypothetical protein
MLTSKERAIGLMVKRNSILRRIWPKPTKEQLRELWNAHHEMCAAFFPDRYPDGIPDFDGDEEPHNGTSQKQTT